MKTLLGVTQGWLLVIFSPFVLLYTEIFWRNEPDPHGGKYWLRFLTKIMLVIYSLIGLIWYLV